MSSIQYEDLARRKAQWSAFHSWQSQNPAPGLSFEERIQWYVAAFRFTRDVLKRVGVHNERGELTLERLLTITTNHIPRHVKFIVEKRQALGLPGERGA